MTWRRGDLVDTWSDGSRTAVFVSDQLLVLSELASAILASVPLGGSAGLTEITAATVAAVGTPEPPTDAAEVVQQHINELVWRGVLECVDTTS